MKRLITLAVVVAIAGAGVTAGAARAQEPTRSETEVHVVSNPWAQCPGFAVIGEFDIVIETTDYYDQAGTLVKRIVVATIDGTLTNATTGYSLSTGGIRIFHYDFVEGTVTTTGTNNFTKLPEGEGVAIGGAGRFVVDATGRLLEHNGPGPEERAQLCSALAGGEL